MRLGICLFAGALALAGAAQGEEPINLDFRVGWNGCYRPLEWTPVEISISNTLSEPTGGVLTLSGAQNSLTNMVIARDLVLTPSQPNYLPLVTKASFAVDSMSVRFYDPTGRRKLNKEFTLWDNQRNLSSLTAVGEGELLIGLAGRHSTSLAKLPSLSIATGGRAGESSRGSGKVYVAPKELRLLPWDWTGYASLDLLVLYDLQWDQLDPHQSSAIVDWVSNGGRLLLVLGSHPLPPQHPFAQMLPFAVNQSREVTLEESMLRECLGDPQAAMDAAEPARRKANTGNPRVDSPPAEKLEPRTVVSWLGEDARPVGGWQLQGTPAVAAYGPVGFGRVGVLAFDPAPLAEEKPENLAPFWISRMGPLLNERKLELGDTRRAGLNGYGSYYYDPGRSGGAVGAVVDHIMTLPEMRPVSVWAMIGLLSALALVLGPIDYFVLKRIDRLPLTWITSAVCIALFTGGAYYGVQWMRGGNAHLRAVSVVDGIAGQNRSWTTCYSGLFAATSGRYQLEGLADDQWWSGLSPSNGMEYYRGGNRGGRLNNDLVFRQVGGANLPQPVPISIWSMQCLLREAPCEGMPLSAEVQREGENSLAVKITNHSDRPISQGIVRVGKDRALSFGAVPPGETREFRGSLGLAGGRLRMGYSTFRQDQESIQLNAEAVYSAVGSVNRTAGIQWYLDQGASVVCARYDGAAPPFTVSGRQCIMEHTQFVRLVVPMSEESSK